MKLKFSTLLALAIAILTAGGLYIWDRSRSDIPEATNKSSSTALFQLQETDITQVSIQTQNMTIALERKQNGWQLTSPKTGPADNATVSYLLNLLATSTVERSLPVSPAELGQFGLDKPTTTLTIQLKTQKSHRLMLGTQTFDQSSVYGRVDPPKSAPPKATVVLLPTSFLNATNRPLSEWQAQPKPSPSPTSVPDKN